MSDIEIIDHTTQPAEEWRPGVVTRMHVSAAVGSHQLCIFEQFCAPGLGAPMHHHVVEETLTVLAGEAEVTVGEAKANVRAGQSVVVGPGIPHGFINVGDGELHVRAILASAVFEAAYEDNRETPRRWLPQS